MERPLLLGCQGCGSVIVQFAFALAGLPCDYEEVDYSPGARTRERLLAVNPLGQVPALVLADGRVLTESLAIILYVNDLVPAAGLIPPLGHASREAFYRWALFLVAAVYPTYTYGDDPGKWVAPQAQATQLRESTDRHRETLYRQLDAASSAPWFLGDTFSAIDLYLLAMTHWRPRGKWFAKHAPKLAAIAERAGALPALAPIVREQFR